MVRGVGSHWGRRSPERQFTSFLGGPRRRPGRDICLCGRPALRLQNELKLEKSRRRIASVMLSPGPGSFSNCECCRSSSQFCTSRHGLARVPSTPLPRFPTAQPVLYTKNFERPSPTLDRAPARRRSARPGARHQRRGKSQSGIRRLVEVPLPP